MTTSTSRPVRLLGVLFALALFASACGDDSSGDSAPTSTTGAPTSTTETDGGGETEGGAEREEAIDEFKEDVRGDLGITEGGDDGDAAGDASSYGEYVEVRDDSNTLAVEVPAEWSDVNGQEGLFGPDVVASTDVDAFLNTFDVPGVEFQATTLSTETPEQVLGKLSDGFAAQCEGGPVVPYEDPLYTGFSRNFVNCAGGDTGFVWVAVEPADQSFIAVVGVQIVSGRDLEALGRILGSFIVGT